MTPQEKVISIAEGEIGYLEKASNSQLNDKTANPGSGNWTKYAAYFDAARGTYNFYNGGKNGFDWCDMFVDWCFCQAFDMDTARKMLYQPMESCGAGCAFSASYYRNNRAWSSGGTTPAPGCQIFFGPKGDESHTGIVVEVGNGKVYTVEGNSGNRVMRREYSLTDSNISGYGYPDWSLVEPEPEPEPALTRSAILDALGDRWVETFDDLPDYAQPAFRALIEAGIYKGVEPSDTVEGTVIRGTVNTHVRAVLIAAAIAESITADKARESLREVMAQLMEKLP